MNNTIHDIPLHVPPIVHRRASVGDTLRLLQWLDTDVAVICDFGPDDLVGWVSRQTLESSADPWHSSAEFTAVQCRMAPTVDACYVHHSIGSAKTLADTRQSPFLAVFDVHETFCGIVFARHLHRHSAKSANVRPEHQRRLCDSPGGQERRR